jgi:hypothetical protein
MKNLFKLISAFWLGLAVPVASASTTITILSTADSGAGTLRAAVGTASGDTTASHFPYTINVPAGTYKLTSGSLPVGGSAASVGEIYILGAGSGTTIVTQSVTGSSGDRVFNIDPDTTGGWKVALAGLTIAGGSDPQDGYGGGGVLTGNGGNGLADALYVTNCVIAHNSTVGYTDGQAGGDGAGINSGGGVCNIVGCTFYKNSVSVGGNQGGGLYYVQENTGDRLTVVNSVFLQNSVAASASVQDIGAEGAGIYMDGTTPVVVAFITNCVFGGNTVTSTGYSANQTFGGGAISTVGGGHAYIIGCTFTNNTATGGGTGGTSGTGGNGGAILAQQNATNIINFCRFVGNTADSGGGNDIWEDSLGGVVTAETNWWGLNTGPASGHVENVTVSHWLFLTNTASLSTDPSGTADTLTASFLKDSGGTTVAASSLTALTNVAVTFGGTDGTISGAQTLIQSSGTATATFTGTTGGAGSGTATVDGATSSASITVEPVVTSVTSSSADYKAGGVVPITVNFSSAVTVTGTPELALTNGTSAVATYASGSGTTALVFHYTVASGDTIPHLDYASTSALTLNGGTIKGGGIAAILTLPSPAATGSLGANATIIIDTTAPTVTLGSPNVTITNATGTISYTVTWADANLNTASISLTGGQVTVNTTGTATTGTPTVTGSGATRTVSVSGLGGNGAISISIPSGTASDFAGNSAPAAGPSATATVDTTAPAVTIGSPNVSITNASGTINYIVTWADANLKTASIALAGGQVTVNKTGTVTAGTPTVTGSGSTRTVSVGGLAGNGTISISIPSGTASDFAGNSAPAAGPSATATVDTTAPTVTIGTPTPSATTNGTGASVAFPVTYFDANFGFANLTAGSITVTGTETAAGTVGGVVGGTGSATGTNYTVTIHNITGYGALGISIASGSGTDLARNTAPAASSSVPAKVMSVPFYTGDYIMANRSYYEMAGLVLLVRSNGVSPAQKVLTTSLYDSYSVALATNGDVYVACYQTPTAFYSSETAADGGVYKIDQYSLAVSPVATSTSFISDYSTNFVTPFALAVETAGTILVADLDAYTNLDANFTDGTVMGGAIFRLNPATGGITVLSTNGPTTGSNFFYLGGIAIGTNGGTETIYVTDHGDGTSPPKVIQINASTGVQTVIFSGSPLNSPDGLAVDPNGSSVTNLVVADNGVAGLIQVSTNSTGSSWIGTTVPVTGGSFAFPTHVAIDPNTGDFLVTDGEPASLANINAGTLWRVYRSDYSLHNWSTGGFFEQPRGILIQP